MSTLTFEIWKTSGNHPDLDSFQATPSAPFLSVQISSDAGASEFAYGVRLSSIGYSAGRVERFSYWEWFDDSEAARKEGLLELWRESEEGRDAQEPIESSKVLDYITDIREHQIELDENPFSVYQVLTTDSLDSWVWKFVWRQEEARELRRESLFKVTSSDRPLIEVPKVEDLADLEVPPVREYEYALCPETSEPLYCYGTWVLCQYHIGKSGDWFLSREEAEAKNSEVAALVRELWEERSADEELKAAEKAFCQVADRADELKTSPLARHLSDEIDQELVNAFGGYQHPGDWDQLRPADFVNAAANLEKATEALKEALEERYLEQLENIETAGLKSKLTQLLEGKSCPLCQQTLQFGDNWLEETLVYRRGRLPCECPQTGWNGEDQESNIPSVVRQFVRFRWDYSGIQGYFGDDAHGAIVVQNLSSESSVLVRLVAAVRNCTYFFGAIEVDIAALEACSGISRPQVFNAWKRQAKELAEEKIRQAEQEVEEGNALLLTFQNHPKHGWQSRTWDGSTNLVYSVDKRTSHPAEVTARVPYYCRIGKTIVNDPGFKVTLVSPFLRGS